jgi:holo-[acyl-carrier-protein] synthase
MEKLMIGIDIIENSRIKQSLQKPNFINMILTKSEQERIADFADKTERIAGIFCVKEAVKKATTFPERIGFLQMEILHEDSGKPYVEFYAEVKDLVKDKIFNISISHSKTVTVAVAIMFDENKINFNIK